METDDFSSRFLESSCSSFSLWKSFFCFFGFFFPEVGSLETRREEGDEEGVNRPGI